MTESISRDHSLAEVIASKLQHRIQDEELKSGHRLGTKEDLRTEYGVAPATLNETLKLLSTRRLIEVRPGPGGGVFVSEQPPIVRLGHKVLSLSADAVNVSDCLVVRNALDYPIAAEAARHATDEDIADLYTMLEDLSRSSSDPSDYLHSNWRLHVRTAQITPNQILKNYYLGVMEYLESHVSNVVPDDASNHFEEGVTVHGALVDAIADHNVEAAIKAIGHHEELTHPSVVGTSDEAV